MVVLAEENGVGGGDGTDGRAAGRTGNLEEWEIWPWPRGMRGMWPVTRAGARAKPRQPTVLSVHFDPRFFLFTPKTSSPPKIAYQFTAIPRLYVHLQLNFPAHSFPVILRSRTSNFFHLYKNVYTYASCRCYVYVCKWNACKYVLFEIRNEDSGEKFFIFHVRDYIAKIMWFSRFIKNSIFTLLLTLIILFSIFHVPDYVAEKCNFLSFF